MKKKLINMFIITSLIISCVSGSVYAYSDNNWELSDEMLIDYAYSNSEVEQELTELIENTRKLKSSYSMDNAKNIIESLENTVKKITKEDYKTQNALLESKSGTEDSYDYMYSEVAWIERNIVNLSVKNLSGNDLSEMLTFICNEYYHIGVTEMQNGAIMSVSMKILSDFDDIMEYVPDDCKDLVEYTYALAKGVSGEYTGDNPPEDIVVSDEFAKNNQDVSSSEDTGDSTPIFIDPVKEEVIDANGEANIDSVDIDDNSLPGYETVDKSAADAYLTTLNNQKNQSKVRESVYNVLNIYYTADKTIDNPTWEDTNITLDAKGNIDYEKFIVALKSISNHLDEIDLYEDSDMVMLIAEGKPLILNQVEMVSKEEIESLFDSYEKVGIKVALKQDEIEEGKESLSNKIEAGEINTVSINGDRLILSNEPILTKNIIQLPVLEVAEKLGYKVKVDGKNIILTYEEKMKSELLEDDTENGTEEVVNNFEIVLTTGSNNYTINGQKNSFKTSVTQENGVIYAEFDKLADKAGYDYFYNSSSGIIEFNK